MRRSDRPGAGWVWTSAVIDMYPSGRQSLSNDSENAARVAPEERCIPNCLPRSFCSRDGTRELAVGKRQRKTPRTPEKEQQAVDNWFPGSGVPPAPEISLPRAFAPPGRTFRDATTDQIKREIALQEELLAGLRMHFPRLTTGTRSELNDTEEEVEKRMEAHERAIQEAKLELLYRGENPSSSDALTRSETVAEEKRSNPGMAAESTEPKSPSASEGIMAPGCFSALVRLQPGYATSSPNCS